MVVFFLLSLERLYYIIYNIIIICLWLRIVPDYVFSVKYHVHRYILYFSSFSSHFLIIYIIVYAYIIGGHPNVFSYSILSFSRLSHLLKSTFSPVFHTMYVVYHVLTHSREQKSIASYHLL